MPVINENDTVVTDEIKFGDNDTLAALVTNLVENAIRHAPARSAITVATTATVERSVTVTWRMTPLERSAITTV